VPSDEIIFTICRGSDSDAVGTAMREVGLGPDLVTQAEELTVPPSEDGYRQAAAVATGTQACSQRRNDK
jgi:hypothetical protein